MFFLFLSARMIRF